MLKLAKFIENEIKYNLYNLNSRNNTFYIGFADDKKEKLKFIDKASFDISERKFIEQDLNNSYESSDS